MNVEIGTEAAQFPEKEYIYGIFLAVQFKAVLRRSPAVGATHTISEYRSGYASSQLRSQLQNMRRAKSLAFTYFTLTFNVLCISLNQVVLRTMYSPGAAEKADSKWQMQFDCGGHKEIASRKYLSRDTVPLN